MSPLLIFYQNGKPVCLLFASLLKFESDFLEIRKFVPKNDLAEKQMGMSMKHCVNINKIASGDNIRS